jgi:hypothetical protein
MLIRQYALGLLTLSLLSLAAGCSDAGPTGPATVTEADKAQLKADEERVAAEERAHMKSGK